MASDDVLSPPETGAETGAGADARQRAIDALAAPLLDIVRAESTGNVLNLPAENRAERWAMATMTKLDANPEAKAALAAWFAPDLRAALTDIRYETLAILTDEREDGTPLAQLAGRIDELARAALSDSSRYGQGAALDVDLLVRALLVPTNGPSRWLTAGGLPQTHHGANQRADAAESEARAIAKEVALHYARLAAHAETGEAEPTDFGTQEMGHSPVPGRGDSPQ